MASSSETNIDTAFLDQSYRTFKKFHAVFAGVHILSAAVFFGIIAWDNFKRDWEVDLELNFNRWDRNDTNRACAADNPCFVNKYVNKDKYPPLSLGVMVVMTSVISGLHHLLAFLLWERNYKAQIENGVVWLRWVDYALSSPLMFIVVATLWVAPPDLRDIIYGFSVQFLVILVGYGAEVAHVKNEAFHKRVLTFGAWVAYLSVWIYLFVVFGEATGDKGSRQCSAHTNFDEEGLETSSADPPFFVYIILFLIFVTFSLFGAVHTTKMFRQTIDSNSPKNPQIPHLRYEAYYAILSMTSKIALLATMAASVISRSDGSVVVEGREQTSEEEQDDYAAVVGLCVGLGTSVIVAIWFWISIKLPKVPKNTSTTSESVNKKLGNLIF